VDKLIKKEDRNDFYSFWRKKATKRFVAKFPDHIKIKEVQKNGDIKLNFFVWHEYMRNKESDFKSKENVFLLQNYDGAVSYRTAMIGGFYDNETNKSRFREKIKQVIKYIDKVSGGMNKDVYYKHIAILLSVSNNRDALKFGIKRAKRELNFKQKGS